MKETIAYLKRIEPGTVRLLPELSDGDQPYTMSFLDDVAIFFLIDEGDRYSLFNQRDFDSQSLTQYQFLHNSICNLERERQEHIEITSFDGFAMFSGSGNLEASLLLIPELWDVGLAKYFPNGCIAAIPARDVLAVCDKSEVHAIEHFKGIVDRVWDLDDHRLTKKLLQRVNGHWVKFVC